MSTWPPELEAIAKFYYVAEGISKFNQTAAKVMRHVFADHYGQIRGKVTDAGAAQWAEDYIAKLAPFPTDGISELSYFADELYEQLRGSVRSGSVSEALPDQFWVCGVIYSVLDSEKAVSREKKCCVAAARLKKMFTKCVKQAPGMPAKSDIGAMKSKPKTDVAGLMRSQAPAAKAVEARISKKPDFRAGFNEKEVSAYVSNIGLAVQERKGKRLEGDARSAVQENLDVALDMLNVRNKRQALAYLRNALALWNEACK
jgi:hypothetical protein